MYLSRTRTLGLHLQIYTQYWCMILLIFWLKSPYKVALIRLDYTTSYMYNCCYYRLNIKHGYFTNSADMKSIAWLLVIVAGKLFLSPIYILSKIGLNAFLLKLRGKKHYKILRNAVIIAVFLFSLRGNRKYDMRSFMFYCFRELYFPNAPHIFAKLTLVWHSQLKILGIVGLP